MFRCERCGSRYSAMYTAALENCPRCQARDQAVAPLKFKAFHLPDTETNSLPSTQMNAPDAPGPRISG
jgi:predicted  nucleic acid-binding Zn-ribbon protein